MTGAMIRLAVVTLVVLVLQVELFSELRVFGVMPELLLGLAFAAGWNSDAPTGAVAGFSAGIAYDLYLSSPLGLAALAYSLVGYAAGMAAPGIADSTEAGVRRIFSVVGVTAGLLLFVVLGELFGAISMAEGRLVRVILLAPLYTAVLMAPLHRAAHWALRSRDAGATSFRRTGMLQ